MKYTVRLPRPGEPVRVSRGHYYHYGICCGPDRIIHFASPAGDGFDDPARAVVHEVSLTEFAREGFTECPDLTVGERRYTFSAPEVIRRAGAALGEKGYNVLNNNCMHFAFRCFYGSSKGPEKKHRLLVQCLIKP